MRWLALPPDGADDVDLGPSAGLDALVLSLDGADGPQGRAARRRAVLGILRHRRGPGPGRDGTSVGGGVPAVMVRVASLASGLVDADLDGVVPGAPDAVLLPGVVGGADLQHLAAKLAVAEAEYGLEPGRTGIVAMPATSAAGVLALGTLAQATPRLRALLWDGGALATAMGLTPDASPVRVARDLLVVASAACGVPAFDAGAPSDRGPARLDGSAGTVPRSPAARGC